MISPLEKYDGESKIPVLISNYIIFFEKTRELKIYPFGCKITPLMFHKRMRRVRNLE